MFGPAVNLPANSLEVSVERSNGNVAKQGLVKAQNAPLEEVYCSLHAASILAFMHMLKLICSTLCIC